MKRRRLVQGNEACAQGGLYAGCDFYAGYPITPATEILEIMAREMPRQGRVFIQMEDEIASISAIIGAAWAGAKTMTATSGPGFSLMQEGIGYAAITETPCVIVDSQRWGPSTGQPTKTSQADLMQARWGTHGDHPVIVLTASGVRDTFEMTVEAFNFAEHYRVPVILLLDEVLSHLREDIYWPEPGELEVIDREPPSSPEAFAPFGGHGFLPLGGGKRFNVTGMAHDKQGFVARGAQAAAGLRALMERIEGQTMTMARYSEEIPDDAETLIVAYGITVRAARRAVQLLAAEGLVAGLLELRTLWPFPAELLRGAIQGSRIKRVLVPELNLGQLVLEVERILAGDVPVARLGRVDGYLITPEQIAKAITEQARPSAASKRQRRAAHATS